MNHFYKTDPKLAYNFQRDYPLTWQCFYKLAREYQIGKQLYVGFPIDEVAITGFVDGFNKAFTNIKMEIVDSIDYYVSGKDIFYGYSVKRYDSLPEDQRSGWNKKPFYLWTLHFTEHTEFVKMCFYVVAGELLRLHVYNNLFHRQQISLTGDVFKNTLDMATEMGKLGTKYGNPYYVPVPYEFTLSFDNVEEINRLLVPGYYKPRAYYSYYFQRKCSLGATVFPTEAFIITEINKGNVENIHPSAKEKVNNPLPKISGPRIYYKDEYGKFCSRENAVNA